MGFECPLVVQHHRAILKLIVVGLCGPARNATDIDKRLVLRPASNLGLNVELERFYEGPFSGPERVHRRQLDIGQPVEELKSDTTFCEDLVEWGENDVAHTGAHLPEERTAIAEE